MSKLGGPGGDASFSGERRLVEFPARQTDFSAESWQMLG
jgi:hypothetical protein